MMRNTAVVTVLAVWLSDGCLLNYRPANIFTHYKRTVNTDSDHSQKQDELMCEE